MIGARAILIASIVAGTAAPFQCASEPDPNRTKEETPGQALKGLADEFGKAGDQEAQKKTLIFLVERYPRSKFAEEAKVELGEMGVDVEALLAKPVASASASAAAPASASATP